ncbi:alpha/beta hydrolase-fold protein [Singulisphaera sp. Ch08]|uniref:Alpha/beta hydrolase-fold protein n=1 Tax=Singulisphaera sp. Ch08 TaxID=3120278 RepID=A0AAU7CK10_9BACT
MRMRGRLRDVLFLILGLVGTASAAPKDAEKLTPKALSERLATQPKGEDAERLAQEIRGWFGKDNLLKGASPKVDGLEVAWAIEVPGEGVAPRVVSLDGSFTLPLVRIGTTNVYAATIPLPDGAALRWAYEVSGKQIERVLRPEQRNANQLEVYSTHPDSLAKSDVPRGKLTQQPAWKSKIFDGTSRDWWVYVPAQYKDDTPACVMIFQDGGGYREFVPTVFDNLIASGAMPVTVAILINPGSGPGEQGRGQRSVEYDTLSDRYSRFLLEEILPEVEKTVKLRHDPESRAISGASSGGICAWTVAWERPDEFRKVLSWVGSFTNIASGKSGREGGHNYEAMIRKTDKKPIRVLLQDGSNDLDNANGNWPLANQQMAKSLKFKDYDYEFVYGQGFHSNKHGRAILPDSLRWLWRGYKAK